MRRLIGLIVLALVLGGCGQTGTGSTGTSSTASSGTANAGATAVGGSAGGASGTANAGATATGGGASGTANAGATATVGGAGGGSGQAVAKAATGTLLRKIQDRGKIVIGVKYDQPGFGYLNPMTNQLEGFDVDIGRAIAKKIFGDEKAAQFKEAISKNRIPYLNDGTVDLVIATMTANEDRAKQIDFSDCYYVAGQKLLVKQGSPINGIGALAGKTVATAKGSTSEKNIRAKAPQSKVDLYDTYADGLQAVLSGRADALTTDDIILYGFEKQNKGQVKVVGDQFTQEPYAIGLQKGHPELIQVVNQVIRDLKSSGAWAELYKKHVSAEKVPGPPPQDWRAVGKST